MSTVGRPRKLTDAQVAKILAWHNARQTVKQFAAEIGLTPKLVAYTIQRRGEYKQPSPELRQKAVRTRREKINKLVQCNLM